MPAKWLESYLDQYKPLLHNPQVVEDLAAVADKIYEAHEKGKKTLIAGNGGSAAMSSHMAVDLTKTAGIRAVNFNEADLITCLANDYGYEKWVQKGVEFYADPGDVVILISSSGKSLNMVNAGKYTAGRSDLTLVTFTGFAKDNPLKQLGWKNLWAESQAYNIVENLHIIWLLAVCDLLIDRKKKAGLPLP